MAVHTARIISPQIHAKVEGSRAGKKKDQKKEEESLRKRKRRSRRRRQQQVEGVTTQQAGYGGGGGGTRYTNGVNGIYDYDDDVSAGFISDVAFSTGAAQLALRRSSSVGRALMDQLVRRDAKCTVVVTH